jgi:fluoroquinolone resistance protein
VIFQDCDLTQANLSGARLEGADLRGSLLNGMRAGVQELQGVTIDPQQAAQVVAILGIQVRQVGE